MKTVHIRIVLASLAVLSMAAGAAAQNSPSLLTSIEVKQLVPSAQPADHARLRDHFVVLAARYTTDADRHVAMGRALTGNPNRSAGANPGGHCTRLVELAKESAATTRELAAHHERLAAGAASIAPKGGAGFEQGAGAPAPRERQILELAAGARTPADHRILEEYFAGLADKYTSEAEEHVALAATYRGTPRIAAAPAVHCDRLAQTARDAATEARAQANAHRSMAGGSGS